MIHRWLFNKVSSSKNSKQTCLIVSRQGLKIKTRRQMDLIRLSQCWSHYFLSKRRFNICKTELFIHKSGCGILVSIEELALAIDKQFQCTQYFLQHYPTRDMQISYKLTISYPNNFIIRMFWKIGRCKGVRITKGLYCIAFPLTFIIFCILTSIMPCWFSLPTSLLKCSDLFFVIIW